MNFREMQKEMKTLCKTDNWQRLMHLLDEGYKGMFVIMRILSESDGNVSAGDLAREMNVSTARIARALNTLEGKGFIKRESETGDARKVIIKLTAQGESALEERKKKVEKMIEPMFEKLTGEEVVKLFSLLKKLLR